MAKLYFYYASMNAGKSTTLLQADFNYRERGMTTMLWTAAVDDRGGEHAIESRIGLHAQAHRFTPETDMYAAIAPLHGAGPVACVLVDEAQFLTAAQVWQLARLADEANVPVLCYGLRTDFRGSCSPARRCCWALRIADRAEGRLPLRAQGDDESARRSDGQGGDRRRADRNRRQ
jgi:thymidine kinase